MFKMDDDGPGYEPARSPLPPQPTRILDIEMFTPRQIAGLVAIRDRFVDGRLSEYPGDYKRLRFARWLYEHGHIDG
jgi:hypothetical protein